MTMLSTITWDQAAALGTLLVGTVVIVGAVFWGEGVW